MTKPRDYRRMLEDGFAQTNNFGGDCPASRLEYLSDHIFDFTTYDGEMSELFARKALEVCAAISNRTTFYYIKDAENHRWFLVMCNMPFFSQRLNWGTSIRGAWWDTSHPNAAEFNTCGLWLDGEQLAALSFSTDQWRELIAAVLAFGASQEPKP